MKLISKHYLSSLSSFSLLAALKNLRISSFALPESGVGPTALQGVGWGKHDPTNSSSFSTKKPGHESKIQNLLYNIQ